MDGIALGQIVHSKAGRDKDKYFIVIDILDDKYVLITDGNSRKIENPKRKKLMHLVCHDKYAVEIKECIESGESISNSDIRKSLKSMGL